MQLQLRKPGPTMIAPAGSWVVLSSTTYQVLGFFGGVAGRGVGGGGWGEEEVLARWPLSLSAYICLCLSVCLSLSLCVCVCVCVCVTRTHARTHARTHTHTRTHTHSHTFVFKSITLRSVSQPISLPFCLLSLSYLPPPSPPPLQSLCARASP